MVFSFEMHHLHLNMLEENVLDVALVCHPSDINLQELTFLGKGIKEKVGINTI